jgi:hypothetical protein
VRQKMTKIGTLFSLTAALVAGTVLLVDHADAARLKFRPLVLPMPGVQLVQSDEYADQGSGGGGVTIRPREAAQIARSAYPGSKVLKVKLLPSGVYAVTLRGDGELTRVMVDGESGNIL